MFGIYEGAVKNNEANDLFDAIKYSSCGKALITHSSYDTTYQRSHIEHRLFVDITDWEEPRYRFLFFSQPGYVFGKNFEYSRVELLNIEKLSSGGCYVALGPYLKSSLKQDRNRVGLAPPGCVENYSFTVCSNHEEYAKLKADIDAEIAKFRREHPAGPPYRWGGR